MGGNPDRKASETAPPRPVLSRAHLPNGLLQAEVKSHLHSVVLAYLLDQPRTGRELMDDIHRDTGVRLSPGRVYPLLRSLERRGLLNSLRGPRHVVYRPADRAQAEESLRQHGEACARLMEFLLRIARGREQG